MCIARSTLLACACALSGLLARAQPPFLVLSLTDFLPPAFPPSPISTSLPPSLVSSLSLIPSFPSSYRPCLSEKRLTLNLASSESVPAHRGHSHAPLPKADEYAPPLCSLPQDLTQISRQRVDTLLIASNWLTIVFLFQQNRRQPLWKTTRKQQLSLVRLAALATHRIVAIWRMFRRRS